MDGWGREKSQACPLSFFYHKHPNFSLSLPQGLHLQVTDTGKTWSHGEEGEREKREREERGAHFLSQTHQEIHVNKLDNSEH